MKIALKVALLAIFAIGIVGFVGDGDPAKILADLQKFSTDTTTAAQSQGREAMSEARAKVIAKAREATNGLDPAKVEPKEGLNWALIFQMGDEEPKARVAAQRFLESNPKPDEKFLAHKLIFRTYLSRIEIAGLKQTLEALAPQTLNDYIQSVYMAVDYFYATSGQAPEDTLRFLDKFEAGVTWKEGDKPIENAYVQIAGIRTELLRNTKQNDKAIRALDSMLAKTGSKGKIGTTIRALRNQVSIVDKPSPALVEERGYGSFPGLEKLKGKVVVLDFFAHWCIPCIAAFPEMKQIYADLKDKGLELIGVTSFYGYYGQEKPLTRDAEYAKMADFIKKHELPWPVQFGELSNFEAFGVTGIPHVVVIDKKGIVRDIKIGYDPRKTEAFRANIEKLLKE